MDRTKNKIAWVLPGGGGRCVYSAGACFAAHKLGLPDPDMIIASSGSFRPEKINSKNLVSDDCVKKSCEFETSWKNIGFGLFDR